MIRIGRLRRDKGISVARPRALGNPYPITPDCSREEAIASYREWLSSILEARSAQKTAFDTRVRAAFEAIVELARAGDVTLLCWCRAVGETGPACHAEVIAEFVRKRLTDQSQREPLPTTWGPT